MLRVAGLLLALLFHPGFLGAAPPLVLDTNSGEIFGARMGMGEEEVRQALEAHGITGIEKMGTNPQPQQAFLLQSIPLIKIVNGGLIFYFDDGKSLTRIYTNSREIQISTGNGIAAGDDLAEFDQHLGQPVERSPLPNPSNIGSRYLVGDFQLLAISSANSQEVVAWSFEKGNRGADHPTRRPSTPSVSQRPMEAPRGADGLREWHTQQGSVLRGVFLRMAGADEAEFDFYVTTNGKTQRVRKLIKIGHLILEDQLAVTALANEQKKKAELERSNQNARRMAATQSQGTGPTLDLTQLMPRDVLLNRRLMPRSSGAGLEEAIAAHLVWWQQEGFMELALRGPWERQIEFCERGLKVGLERFLKNADKPVRTWGILRDGSHSTAPSETGYHFSPISPGVLTEAVKGPDILVLNVSVIEGRVAKYLNRCPLIGADAEGSVSFSMNGEVFEAKMTPPGEIASRENMAYELKIAPNSQTEEIESGKRILALRPNCLQIISPLY